MKNNKELIKGNQGLKKEEINERHSYYRWQIYC